MCESLHGIRLKVNEQGVVMLVRVGVKRREGGEGRGGEEEFNQ